MPDHEVCLCTNGDPAFFSINLGADSTPFGKGAQIWVRTALLLEKEHKSGCGQHSFWKRSTNLGADSASFGKGAQIWVRTALLLEKEHKSRRG